jgi:SAM-dependent methyltransferase
MSERYTDDQIKDFWTEQAVQHQQSPDASWSDRRVIELEIAEMLKHIADGDRLLDIGCANGYSTFAFAAARKIEATGVDYIPEMIAAAKQRSEAMRGTPAGAVKFDVGDILALNPALSGFDKVVVTRVLINLGSWERQRTGLLAAIKAVKPGGLLLLSEATRQGWERLNLFRREWGLPDIAMPPFNLYLDQDQVIETAAPLAKLVEVSHFASTYYAATRVFKPLLNQALGNRVDVADPHAEFNRWCAALPPAGDYGVQRLFIFQRL